MNMQYAARRSQASLLYLLYLISTNTTDDESGEQTTDKDHNKDQGLCVLDVLPAVVHI